MLFDNIRKKNRRNENFLRSLNTREVKCVAIRNSCNYEEKIIARDGEINIHNDELIIISGNEIVFRHKLEGLESGEFLSHDGINLRYTDMKSGEKITLVVYFKYHLK